MRQISPFAIVNKGYFWPTRHSNPISLSRVKVAVAIFKKYRKIARASEVLNTTFLGTKRALENFEPGIFERYPIRKGGKPAKLRVELSKSELEFAKSMYCRMPLLSIARKLGLWNIRLEYILWKAGIHRPGNRFRPMSGDAPDNWPKSWQREYIMTEMKKDEQRYEATKDLITPKQVFGEDDLDEINELLKEYGIE